MNAPYDSEPIALTPEVMLRAYSVGIFPMAQSATDDRLVWFDPDPRGVLPLDRFHLSHRMARAVRAKREPGACLVVGAAGARAGRVRLCRQCQTHGLTAQRRDERGVTSVGLDFERQLGRALDAE